MDEFKKQINGEISYFIYVWDFIFFLFEFLGSVALIAIVIIRNYHKTYIFRHLYISELDESDQVLELQKDLLKPL